MPSDGLAASFASADANAFLEILDEDLAVAHFAAAVPGGADDGVHVAGSVFSFFIFMTYHFIETIQASSVIGVVFCICLKFLYRHGDSRGSSFVSARYLSWAGTWSISGERIAAAFSDGLDPNPRNASPPALLLCADRLYIPAEAA